MECWLADDLQSIGFGAPLAAPTVRDTLKASTTDLKDYGLIPEFLGRLPVLSVLHPLANADLIRILTEPRNALIKQYKALFRAYGSELHFTHRALEAIAQEGLDRGGGARGLRGVLEEILVDAMFEVPGSVSCTTSTRADPPGCAPLPRDGSDSRPASASPILLAWTAAPSGGCD